jgi:asparagine synthase (glutamine-hydrolysing)
MTAFAVVLAPHESLVTSHLLGRIGAALEAVTGARAGMTSSGCCALLLSPLHSSDPARPIVHPLSHVAVTGQVLLEDRRALIERLDLDRDASDLDIVAASFNQWGTGCTEHLNGEYAFALWDPDRHTLVCARDGLGIRLLYLGEGAGSVVVSNVMAAVLAHPSVSGEIDAARLVAFLASGRVSTQTRTAYRAIRAIPEGHTLSIQFPTGSRTLRRHWWMPAPETIRARDDREILAGYRDVLAAAVSDRARDGPVGIFLSGGIDSTTVAAAAQDDARRGHLHAFTVVYGRLLPGFDELAYAASAAERLVLPLTVLEGDQDSALEAERTGLSLMQPVDEPTLANWRSTLGRAAHYSTVALYGEDGDAVFLPPGGRELLRAQPIGSIALSASHYLIARRSRPYVGLRLRDRFRALIGRIQRQPDPARPPEAGHDQQVVERLRDLTSMPPRQRPDIVPPRWLTPEAVRLLQHEEPETLFGQRPMPLRPHATRSRVQERLTGTVPPFAETIGPEVTRQPLEIRLPILDTRVLRYVLSVPAIPWCQHKELPRAAYRGILPDAILDRPKTPLVGFYEALVQSWRERIGGHLPAIASLPREWIDWTAWHETLSVGRPSDVMVAWHVVQLDAWLGERASGPEPLCIA